MGSQNRKPGPIALGAVLCGVVWGAAACGSDSGAGRDPVAESVGRQGGTPDAPTRIVSLVPAVTEILFALGAGDRLVGRTHWGVHPPEAVAIPDLGDGVRPALEAILSRAPDLVILFEGADTEGVADRLAALGVRSLALRHNTLGDLSHNVGVLGDVLGCPAAAAELNDRVRTGLESVSEAVASPTPVRVYYDVWADPPMTIGRGSFLDSLLVIAGAENVFGDQERASPLIGLEAIVERDPEVVVHPVSNIPGSDAVPPGDRPGWGLVGAVAAGRVVTVDADLLGRLGPRVGDAARELALALRPSVSIPPLDVGPLAAVCVR